MEISFSETHGYLTVEEAVSISAVIFSVQDKFMFTEIYCYFIDQGKDKMNISKHAKAVGDSCK